MFFCFSSSDCPSDPSNHIIFVGQILLNHLTSIFLANFSWFPSPNWPLNQEFPSFLLAKSCQIPIFFCVFFFQMSRWNQEVFAERGVLLAQLPGTPSGDGRDWGLLHLERWWLGAAVRHRWTQNCPGNKGDFTKKNNWILRGFTINDRDLEGL